ncbi:MAG: hypothetical protein CVU08_12785 [Bacteroidetes bacterium HGW-Bacteroidetes-3]|nr:MAG: hypothetical protein CVU08_12785 [Bacteroidetes bacterium HGW-Bacteroidetes-3]
MKKSNNTLLALLLVFLAFACDDIFEEDISNDILQIISPIEGETIQGNTVQFSWQNLDGADGYRIQVINANHIYEVDSLVSVSTLVYILNPGEYQWRIRAENFAYTSPYTFPVNFTIVISDDLSDQTVALHTPSDNFYTNNTNIIFTWNEIISADYYNIEIIKKFNGQQTVFQQSAITVTNLNIDPNTFDEDAEYIWKIKALNSISETTYSERSVFIDRVIPSQPLLVSPLDQETESTAINFNWTNGVDLGNVKSVITNKIDIATDIDFNSIIHSANTTNNTYQFEFDTVGTYFWRIKAIDAATNESDYSNVRTVVVQ